MGSEQWDYCRDLLRRAGVLPPAEASDRPFAGDASRAARTEAFLRRSEAIYHHAGAARPAFPGGEDSYRRLRYEVDCQDPLSEAWSVVGGEVEAAATGTGYIGSSTRSD